MTDADAEAGANEPTPPSERRARRTERRGPSFVPPPTPNREGPTSPFAPRDTAAPPPAAPPIQWAGNASPPPPPAGPRPDPPAGAADALPPPPPTWPARTGRPAGPQGPVAGATPRPANQPWQYVVLGLLVAVVLYYATKGGSLRRTDLVFFAVLIPSIILHEVSHGAVALLFGDDTAKRAGRLTLNPLKHIDPFWTILLPAMMIFYTGRAFGMAKPVPVNPGRMRSPRNHGMLTALAGPATNILIAAFAWFWYRVLYGDENPFLLFGGAGNPPLGPDILFNLGLANVVLAAFNLLPIPPLDGSAVVQRILPSSLLEPYLRLRQFSFFLFIGLYLVGANVFSAILNPVVDLWFRLLFT
jgi:Zn-dependent protease